jgi:hypothetical protein
MENSKERTIKDLVQLETTLKRITKDLQKIEDSWPDHFNENDPEDMYVRSSFNRFEDKLSDVRRMIQGIGAPVVAQGRLYHNESKRYEIEGTDYYFTSGSSIEVLYEGEWIPSSVEHSGKDYYLTRLKSVSMEGLTARAKSYPSWD